jgi:hypothetical protein
MKHKYDARNSSSTPSHPPASVNPPPPNHWSIVLGSSAAPAIQVCSATQHTAGSASRLPAAAVALMRTRLTDFGSCLALGGHGCPYMRCVFMCRFRLHTSHSDALADLTCSHAAAQNTSTSSTPSRPPASVNPPPPNHSSVTSEFTAVDSSCRMQKKPKSDYQVG